MYFADPDFYTAYTGNAVLTEYKTDKQALLSYDSYRSPSLGLNVNGADGSNNNDSLPWCTSGENSVGSMFVYMENELAEVDETMCYSQYFGISATGEQEGCEYMLINKYTGGLIEKQ